MDQALNARFLLNFNDWLEKTAKDIKENVSKLLRRLDNAFSENELSPERCMEFMKEVATVMEKPLQ